MTKPLLAATAIAAIVFLAGGLATRRGPWFDHLHKPRWTPPGWLFGPMWLSIAALAVWSAADAWTAAPGAHGRIVLLFGVNAVLNMAWSPLFFLLRRPDWAFVEVLILWLSIGSLLTELAPFSPLSAWLLTPYFAWVSLAALLNFEIVRLNAPFSAARTA